METCPNFGEITKVRPTTIFPKHKVYFNAINNKFNMLQISELLIDWPPPLRLVMEKDFSHISLCEEQKEEFFRENIYMIVDANSIYQRRTAAMHRQIFELEEIYRLYSVTKEKLVAGVPEEEPKKKDKKRKKGPAEVPEEIIIGCEAPIDLSELKTIDDAKEVYSQLLLDYLEHQTVLDAIIGQKKERVNTLKSELIEMGWSEKVLTPEKIKKARRSSGISSVLKFRSRSHSMNKIEVPAKLELPEGPIVSKIVYSNKDILQNQRGNSSSTLTEDSFEIMSVIGQGAFGKVYLVIKKQTGQYMAMKVMSKSSILDDGDDSLRHVIHELEFMRDMSHHPFIVSLYHAFQTNTEVSLVMEWIGGGTVFDYLVTKDVPFSEKEAQFFSAQVLVALQSLHANNIVYRDLKLENILLDEDGYVRLSDFGLSARAKRGERINSFSGTATYLAPEIILDQGEDGHTHCVDLWCFGVMLFIMLTQEPPFWSEHYPDLFHLIKTSDIPYECYDYLSNEAISVLKGLLTKDPADRLGCGPRGIADVQDHPFFRSMDWKALLSKKIAAPVKPKIDKGKRVDEYVDEDEEQGDDKKEKNGKQSAAVIPAETFKGFSFVWDPSDQEKFLSESIGVLRGGTEEKSDVDMNIKKNKIVVNFFLLLKEIQGLPASQTGKKIFVTWKHEAKKYLTIIGAEDERSVDQTEAVLCSGRSVSFAGSSDNACIACDYSMSQDRKTLAFDSRILSFQLMSPKENKRGKNVCLGKVSIDLSQFSYHKLEKTQIFSFGDSGVTLVLSILCSWKSFNGDLVDNYDDATLKPKSHPAKEEEEEGDEEEATDAGVEGKT